MIKMSQLQDFDASYILGTPFALRIKVDNFVYYHRHLLPGGHIHQLCQSNFKSTGCTCLSYKAPVRTYIVKLLQNGCQKTWTSPITQYLYFYSSL